VGAIRVLLTNTSLGDPTGSESYLRDLAVGLLRRGHAPAVYSPKLGAVAGELRRATVPVTADLGALDAPDLVHGNQGPELMAALLRFPGCPGVAHCHSWFGFISEPPAFPRIMRYAAVDDTCLDRLRIEHGIGPERTAVLRNAVDLERFAPRSPLPPQPRRALVFSNYAGEDNWLPTIREACARTGIELDVMGLLAGSEALHPEHTLPRYDLVFAKARCALEAMAVGAAVILCDTLGFGGLVRRAEVERLRLVNFGVRALSHEVTLEAVLREIGRYDPEDAAAVSAHVRAECSLDGLLDDVEEVYAQVLEEHAAGAAPDPAAETLAAASYITRLGQALLAESANFASVASAQGRALALLQDEQAEVHRRYAELHAEYTRLARERNVQAVPPAL
jgi:hypothetical protein